MILTKQVTVFTKPEGSDNMPTNKCTKADPWFILKVSAPRKWYDVDDINRYEISESSGWFTMGYTIDTILETGERIKGNKRHSKGDASYYCDTLNFSLEMCKE